jgi:hypothetical protein
MVNSSGHSEPCAVVCTALKQQQLHSHILKRVSVSTTFEAELHRFYIRLFIVAAATAAAIATAVAVAVAVVHILLTAVHAPLHKLQQRS